MRVMLFVFFYLASLLPTSLIALSEQSEGDQLFASKWIEPSEASLKLIELMFKGQVSTLPKTHQEMLDKSLKRGDWSAMDTARQAAAGKFGVEAVLDWSATRHLAGYLGASSRYGLDLFSIGKAANRSDIIEAGVGIWFYIYGVILIDGYKCTDPSSPEVFMNQTMDAYADVRAIAATLSEQKLNQAIEYAVASEKVIAPDRASDPTICVHGDERLDNFVALNDAMNKTLKVLEQREEERVTTGEPQTELPDTKTPSWIKPEAEWLSDAAEAREALPGWLSELSARLTAG